MGHEGRICFTSELCPPVQQFASESSPGVLWCRLWLLLQTAVELFLCQCPGRHQLLRIPSQTGTSSVSGGAVITPYTISSEIHYTMWAKYPTWRVTCDQKSAGTLKGVATWLHNRTIVQSLSGSKSSDIIPYMSVLGPVSVTQHFA